MSTNDSVAYDANTQTVDKDPSIADVLSLVQSLESRFDTQADAMQTEIEKLKDEAVKSRAEIAMLSVLSTRLCLVNGY